MSKRTGLWAAVLALLVIGAACGGDTAGEGSEPEITVGSANFTESIILAEIYAQALEAEDYDVSKRLNIGAREVYFRALERGTVDLLPEYTGSLVRFVTRDEASATPDSDETYERLRAELEERDITALQMSDAQDKDGIVVNKETADQYDLETVSDLQPVASELVMGGPPECPERQACLKGLQDVYDIEFREFKPLDPSGPQTVELLASDEIQVANLFTTDARIAAREFVLLSDDQGIVPAENVLPIVRDEIVEAYGVELVELLNNITAKLTTEGLTELNRRADVDKDDPDDIAGSWLRDNGFI